MPPTATQVDVTELGIDVLRGPTMVDVEVVDAPDGTIVEVSYRSEEWELVFDEHGRFDSRTPADAAAPQWLAPAVIKAEPFLSFRK